MSQTEFFDQRDTLHDAKIMVGAQMGEGVECPCCGQYCKVYPRSLHSSMANQLIRFYRLAKLHGLTEFYHYSRIVTSKFTAVGGADFAKLALWDLTVPAECVPGENNNGYWKITAKGIDFVEKRIRVPKNLYVFNAKILKTSDELVGIEECLNNKFDYRELMEGQS